jgi:ABC-type transporter Mla maintaining outer membrane lipid asymmetry permease subunit MlaE
MLDVAASTWPIHRFVVTRVFALLILPLLLQLCH